LTSSTVATAPRILLFALQTSHSGSCRLPKLFQQNGFTVAVLGLRRSLLLATRYADARFILHARRFEPLIRLDLERVFASFAPDIIVPCDERAVSILNHWMSAERARLSPALLACLDRSLGTRDILHRASKKLTLEVARATGVRCPRDLVVNSVAECETAAETLGYPVIMKLSHGTGGAAVKLCRTREDLERVYKKFDRGRSIWKTLRRRLFRRDWFGGHFDILIQEHIPGQPAMSCAAAVGGATVSIVSGFAGMVINQMGPASIVKLVNHAEIVDATTRMVKAFGASGFLSFDFVVDAEGRAHLLECNPRPTQIMHLGHLVGLDLARSYLAALQEGAPALAEQPVGEKTVAFFPQEWRRDPISVLLNSALHDVPWDDPGLMVAMVNKRPMNWRRQRIP
jgi:hypothetical protein